MHNVIVSIEAARTRQRLAEIRALAAAWATPSDSHPFVGLRELRRVLARIVALADGDVP